MELITEKSQINDLGADKLLEQAELHLALIFNKGKGHPEILRLIYKNYKEVHGTPFTVRLMWK